MPYVLAVATSSNIGSTATITGNPQNMLIGSLSTITGSVANIIVVERAAAEGVNVGFREYFRIGLPVTAATLVLGSAWLWITAP